MNLDDTPQSRAFRREVSEFLAAALPADLREKVIHHKRLGKDDFVRWHRIVHARGWVGASWPEQYGGTGWTPLQQHIWDVESSLAGAPIIQPFGVNMVAPVIMAYGNEAQKRRYLPRILSCEDWWCQGYSEPGAGSDLASLRLKAQRRGDHYVLDGQKTWTTMAQYADMMFCLVRTSSEGRKQEGISFLLIDMKTPGITVRPIELMHGEPDVNDVFFEDVAVPAENLIGEENRGWTYAKYLLGHERTGIAGLGHCRRELRVLKELAARTAGSDGRPIGEDRHMRERIARVEVDVMALEMLLLRVASARGDAAPGPEASVLKIRGSEIQQDLAMLQMEIAGPDAWPYDPEWMQAQAPWHGPDGDRSAAGAGYADMRKTTIYGGSTEIQKGIIARMILG